MAATASILAISTTIDKPSQEHAADRGRRLQPQAEPPQDREDG
jgi:hypothetical protein